MSKTQRVIGLVYCTLRGRLQCIYCGVTNWQLCWIKSGNKLESKVKSKAGSKSGTKNSILAFLKCMDGSILAFLKYTDGSILVSLKYMDVSVLAHLRLSIQSVLSRFPQSGNSGVPQLLCKKTTKMSYLKQNEISYIYTTKYVS